MLLNVHSYYSLRYGTLSLEDLVAGLKTNGYDTAVLTDINNSSGVLPFIRQCRKQGINGLAGMEFRNGDRLMYTGIAADEQGFGRLNAFQTARARDRRACPDRAPELEGVYWIYPLGGCRAEQAGPNAYIGVGISQLNKIRMLPRRQLERYVISQPLSFAGEEGWQLHRRLRAIDNNLLISQLQPGQLASPAERWLTRSALLAAYRDFPELIHNTEGLLARCRFDFDYGKVRNKQSFTGAVASDRELLASLAAEGMERRYGKADTAARLRMERELEIIGQQSFAAYFLMTDDLCRYARNQGYHYVGRGSGANSLVAYCLGITDVCPLELDLYFERFLNPKRRTPPDFDIDFCWEDRDDIYGYLFGRYPAGTVALMGAISSFQSRSVLRELGKIYGLPKAEIDRMVHEPGHLLNRNEVTELILSVCKQVQDFPNQRTIHASGVLIGEQQITDLCALDYPPKGWPVTQFDMYTAEDICFEKLDVLSQRGIGHIHECVRLVAANRGEQVDVTQPRRFFSDPQIAGRLRTGDTIGCFYVESPAMRQLLTKLDCDNYRTLVAASSIIRPGVASSGMMKAYIERHRDPGQVVYPHPVFRDQLQETYGVMVYQEDVMKIGHYYGGLDLADADVLRRMMSGKSRNPEQLREIAARFFDHCYKQGYPEDASREIWRQMESFAGFSFNKAHSASYAVESYQSLFLKTRYPLEFMVAVLNNYGGFYQRKVYVSEALKAGAVIRLPCVNHSGCRTRISGKDIYLGFDGLQHLEVQLSHRIVEERERNGDYQGLGDFADRTGAGLEQLLVLVRCAAFRFTGIGKKELLWAAHLLRNGVHRQPQPRRLFDQPTQPPVLPALDSSVTEDLYDELELLGFTVSGTLFDLARSSYRGDTTAAALTSNEGRTVRIVGNFVCDKQLRTRNGQAMKFGTFQDVHGDFFDTVHFPPVLKAWPLNGNGIYLIQGRVVLDFGSPCIEVEKAARMPLKPDPRSE